MHHSSGRLAMLEIYAPLCESTNASSLMPLSLRAVPTTGSLVDASTRALPFEPAPLSHEELWRLCRSLRSPCPRTHGRSPRTSWHLRPTCAGAWRVRTTVHAQHCKMRPGGLLTSVGTDSLCSTTMRSPHGSMLCEHWKLPPSRKRCSMGHPTVTCVLAAHAAHIGRKVASGCGMRRAESSR